MVTRALAGAAALAFAAGSQAAVSASFAAGSANVERLFEITDNNFAPANNGGGQQLVITVVEGAQVDLVVNMGQDLGLVSRRAGFEGMFYADLGSPVGNGVGPVLAGDLNGGFRFFNPDNYDETLLAGFVSDGISVFVLDFGLPRGGPPEQFIAGSLIDATASYFLNDPFNPSPLGFPGGGLMGDFAMTLTNFVVTGPRGDGSPFASATGSFSGTFIPSTGTGVLSALAFGVVAGRRRR